MAVVQIADIYNPLIWKAGIQEKAIELNKFLQCGVMVDNPLLKEIASGPGSLGELPFIKGLANVEPNYSTDDPAVFAVPAKITGGKEQFRKSFQNGVWSAMDLAVEIALVKPVEAITGRIGQFWAVHSGKRLINSFKGIMADNVANDASDMVVSVATLETGAAPSDAKCINSTLVIDAVTTAGDHMENFSCICMHSIPYAKLLKANLITFVPISEQTIKIPYYLGLQVIVDDALAPRAGTISGFVYTTILCGRNCVGYGLGEATVPTEHIRIPGAGNGGGQDVFYSRNTEILHPYGFAFTSVAVVGQSATYAELATATNWNRVYAERKNISCAFILTNG